MWAAPQTRARPPRLVVEAIGLQIFRYIGVVEDHLAVAVGRRIAFGDGRVAGAQRFDFGAGQHQAGLEHFADLVIEPGASIVGHDLVIRLLLFGHLNAVP